MIPRHLLLVLLLGVAAIACKSSGGAKCEIGGGQPLAASAPWPKFRRDVANTGRTDASIDLSSTTGVVFRWVFPDLTSEPFNSISTSPIVGEGDTVYLVGETPPGQGTTLHLYALDAAGEDVGGFDLSFPPSVTSTITSVPLLTAPANSDPQVHPQIVIPLGQGQVERYDLTDRLFLNGATVSGGVSSSPAVDNQGDVFVNSLTGNYFCICQNGVAHFARVTGAGQAAVALDVVSPAVVQDDVTIVAGTDGRLRAFNVDGTQLWLFSASAPINAAPVIDATRRRAYVADSAGKVFAVGLLHGRRCSDFAYDAGAPISASPALGRDGSNGPETFYVATEDGVLAALNLPGPSFSDTTKDACEELTAPPTPMLRWQFTAGGTIRSSPAVTTGGDHDVVVFGADDGNVYAIADDGSTATQLWKQALEDGGAVGTSSAALGSDGAIYIATQGGRLYALEPMGVIIRTITPTTQPTPTATPIA